MSRVGRLFRRPDAEQTEEVNKLLHRIAYLTGQLQQAQADKQHLVDQMRIAHLDAANLQARLQYTKTNPGGTRP